MSEPTAPEPRQSAPSPTVADAASTAEAPAAQVSPAPAPPAPRWTPAARVGWLRQAWQLVLVTVLGLPLAGLLAVWAVLHSERGTAWLLAAAIVAGQPDAGRRIHRIGQVTDEGSHI